MPNPNANAPLRPRRVRLLEEDPELTAVLTPAERQLAAQWTVTAFEIAPRTVLQTRAVGLVIVLDGFLTYDSTIGAYTRSYAFGPGDVAAPETALVARTRSLVAVLDGDALVQVCRLPRMMIALLERTTRQSRRALDHAGESALEVEARLQRLLWRLANQHGKVTADGVLLDLPLTHDLIGRMIGSRRPTVSIQLSRMQERGLVTRAPGRGWLLHGTDPGGD